jgi:hypothetical protein
MLQLQLLPKHPAQWTVSSLKFTYLTPNPICYTKSCIVQQNVGAMSVSHASDLRHLKSERVSVCLSLCSWSIRPAAQLAVPLQLLRLYNWLCRCNCHDCTTGCAAPTVTTVQLAVPLQLSRLYNSNTKRTNKTMSVYV